MQIYNSMTRKKEPFVPLHEGKVGIYACGPTVYNFFHIGNARPFIVFDVLRRYLEYRGYEVTFVQNFTDIDDKMIRRANEEGVTVGEIAERYIAEYFTDAKALGIRPATVHPRATEHIPQIIALIQRLIDKGLAYESQGDVYYRVRAFPSCPGWHIECSAMSTTYLGETFDIHGGGKDLLFPHHENEIAQTSGATGKPYVRYWMHNGFINIDNEKMSKSKGNFFTVRDISKEFDLEAVRLFMLSAHYRSPINFSRDLIEAAASSLERLYNARDQLQFLLTSAQDRTPDEGERAFMDECLRSEEKFIAAMDDDLNTADALAALFELVRAVYRLPQGGVSREAVQLGLDKMHAICGVLGLLMKEEGAIPAEVQALVDERAEARKNKDWKRSDELRDQIKAMGYILEDTKAGQKVRKGGA